MIEATWTGPYSWQGFELENELPSIPEQPGLYLQTVRHKDGYLIYAAGLTRRTIKKRFREHTRKYKLGEYNVLDITAMEQGIRKELWHGWGWTPAKQMEFEKRKTLILDSVQKQLAGFRIFVADIGTEARILERFEAAIMNCLYTQPSPLCDIPDKGMMLAPRWNTEFTVIVRNKCCSLLHGLPDYLEI